MSNAWHYTTGNKLHPIAMSSELRPTAVGAAPHERPILWFSKNQVWEPTATKHFIVKGQQVRPTVKQLHEALGLYRFGVPEESAWLKEWTDISVLAGTPREEIEAMRRVGMRWGANPDDWLGCFRSVDLHEPVFEAWNGLSWEVANVYERARQFMAHGPLTVSVKGTLLGKSRK